MFTCFGLSSLVSSIVIYNTLDSLKHEFFFSVGAATSLISAFILIIFFEEKKVRYV